MKLDRAVEKFYEYQNEASYWEQQKGITAGELELVSGGTAEDEWAIFHRPKSDGSITVFFTIRNPRTKDSWRYLMCPSAEHINFFRDILPKHYDEIDKLNTKNRWK